MYTITYNGCLFVVVVGLFVYMFIGLVFVCLFVFVLFLLSPCLDAVYRFGVCLFPVLFLIVECLNSGLYLLQCVSP